MKVLFVTDECFQKTGGGTYTKALINIFKSVVGSENFYIFFPYSISKDDECKDLNILEAPYAKPTQLIKILNLLRDVPLTFTTHSIKALESVIEEKQIDTIIIGRSFLGGALKKLKIKKRNIKVITFFHDVIVVAIKERLMKEKKMEFLKNLPRLLSAYRNEKISLKLSDKTVVLNERDKTAFIENYGRVPDITIPIFCQDSFDINRLQKKQRDVCNLLFVGSYYWPNVKGIKWFVDNVMPLLTDEYKLYIVGKNFEKMKEELESEKVFVVGTVDDLGEWYYKADIVVGPIFDGTGMKTKTVEALMYGKVYLGAEEALCGYRDIDDFLCLSESEFVNKIVKYYSISGETRYSEYARNVYEKYYSQEVISKSIGQLLNN